MTSERVAAKRWLQGPVADIALGCGVAYLLVFVLFAAIGPRLEILVPAGLTPLLSMTMGTPHYGATLRRVYADPANRRKYAFFSVWATAVVWGTFAVGLHAVAVGSVFITIYLTWSPWHYSGQNYGIALMFLRRRGVEITPVAKRALWISFVTSFLLASLALHGEVQNTDYVPASNTGSDFRILSLGVPSAVVPVLALIYIASAGTAATLLLRKATLRDLVPSLLVMLTQSMWFSVPFLVRHAGLLQDIDPLSRQHAGYAFFWIASAHSIQYLWVTDYFERREHPDRSHRQVYGRSLLAGAAIWGVPLLVFAPSALGPVPYDAGLFVMVAAAVNLHHFILDGAIWKLRDGAIAKILLRDGSGAPAPSAPANRLAGRGALGIGGIVATIQVIGHVDADIKAARALRNGDAASLSAAIDRLELVGRASSRLKMEAALLKQSSGDLVGADTDVREALALYRNYETLHNYAVYLQRMGRGIEAIDATREALDLYEHAHGDRPTELEHNLAWMLVTYEPNDADAATEAGALARGVLAKEDRPRARFTLALALQTLGQTGAAQAEAARAFDEATVRRDALLAQQIAQRFPDAAR